MKTLRLIALALLFTALVLPPATAGEPAQATGALQLGSTASGLVAGGKPAVFEFEAETAGVLTVVVRGAGGADLILLVTDDIGQALGDARSDQDLGGDASAEQLMTALTVPGTYHVRVEAYSGQSSFEIAAGWIAFPSMEAAADADSRPTEATSLVPGTPVSDSLDPNAGDGWDWYAVTSETGGLITVLTESSEGDLALEVFAEGEFGEAITRSDQDTGGVSGNESITMRIEAGQTLYFKVSPVFSFGEAVPYTIRAGVM